MITGRVVVACVSDHRSLNPRALLFASALNRSRSSLPDEMIGSGLELPQIFISVGDKEVDPSCILKKSLEQERDASTSKKSNSTLIL